MSATSTTFLPARDFSPATPLTIHSPSHESFGSRHTITTAGKKSLVLTFKNCQVKCCLDKKNRPFLISQPEDNQELISTFEQVRARVRQEMALDDSVMRPILTKGAGLMKKKLSLFLNMTANATLKDLQKQPVDYQTLVGKHCKLHLFVHLQSVFKGEDEQYAVQFRVSHMILTQTPAQEVVEVEQVQLEEPEDAEALL